MVAETQEEMECFLAYEDQPATEFVATFAQVLDEGARKRYMEWANGINGREPITVGDGYGLVSDRAPIPN